MRHFIIILALAALVPVEALADHDWTVWGGRCNRFEWIDWATQNPIHNGHLACDLMTSAPYNLGELDSGKVYVPIVSNCSAQMSFQLRVCRRTLSSGTISQTCGNAVTVYGTGSDTYREVAFGSGATATLPSTSGGDDHLYVHINDSTDSCIDSDRHEADNGKGIHIYVKADDGTGDTNEDTDYYSGAGCRSNLDDPGIGADSAGSWPVAEHTECEMLTPGRMMYGGADGRLPSHLSAVDALMRYEGHNSETWDNQGKVCAKRYLGGYETNCRTPAALTTSTYPTSEYRSLLPSAWGANDLSDPWLWSLFVAMRCADADACRVHGYKVQWSSIP